MLDVESTTQGEMLKYIKDLDMEYVSALRKHFISFIKNYGRLEDYLHIEAVEHLLEEGLLTHRDIHYAEAKKVSSALKQIFEPAPQDGRSRYMAFRASDVKILADYYGVKFRVEPREGAPLNGLQLSIVNPTAEALPSPNQKVIEQ